MSPQDQVHLACQALFQVEHKPKLYLLVAITWLEVGRFEIKALKPYEKQHFIFERILPWCKAISFIGFDCLFANLRYLETMLERWFWHVYPLLLLVLDSSHGVYFIMFVQEDVVKASNPSNSPGDISENFLCPSDICVHSFRPLDFVINNVLCHHPRFQVSKIFPCLFLSVPQCSNL